MSVLTTALEYIGEGLRLAACAQCGNGRPGVDMSTVNPTAAAAALALARPADTTASSSSTLSIPIARLVLSLAMPLSQQRPALLLPPLALKRQYTAPQRPLCVLPFQGQRGMDRTASSSAMLDCQILFHHPCHVCCRS